MAKPKLGMNVHQYVGNEGSVPFTVKILSIGEKSEGDVLIEFRDIEDTLNCKVYRYKKEVIFKDMTEIKYQYTTDEVVGNDSFTPVIIHQTPEETKILVRFLEDDLWKAVYPKMFQKNLDPFFMYKYYMEQVFCKKVRR
ncbi:hypothetical protein [Aureivirga sp. CE67]|uniref:hypothetical protein n=1 Tax=Aureivirga sp. CE67 TaxID=1788983 RepID=UPI0018CA08FC|nr:hypothetical protein [Aureivirga sp. CE67]